MRRAIFIAAIALGSGCIISTSSNEGDATLYWSFWTTYSHGGFGTVSSTATQVCSQAGVDVIKITLIDPQGYALPISSGPCITGGTYDTPGIVFTALEPGVWDYQISGFRAGVEVFSDAGTFNVYDQTDTVVDTNLTANYGDLELHFNVPTCVAGDTIEFDLVDTTWGLLYSTYQGTTNPPVAVPCAGLNIPSVPQFVSGISSGSYKLSNLVQLDNLGAAVSYPACIPNWTQPVGGKVLGTITIDSATSPGATYCLPG
jgi:hypothetical protein